jgi:hypothetical protein
MTRPTNIANFVTPLSDPARQTPRALMSDEQLADLGRAQIAAGDCIQDDELDAFLDSLQIPEVEG